MEENAMELLIEWGTPMDSEDLYEWFSEEIEPILARYGIEPGEFKDYGYITSRGYIAFGKLRGIYDYTLDDSPIDKVPNYVIRAANGEI